MGFHAILFPLWGFFEGADEHAKVDESILARAQQQTPHLVEARIGVRGGRGAPPSPPGGSWLGTVPICTTPSSGLVVPEWEVRGSASLRADPWVFTGQCQHEFAGHTGGIRTLDVVCLHKFPRKSPALILCVFVWVYLSVCVCMTHTNTYIPTETDTTLLLSLLPKLGRMCKFLYFDSLSFLGERVSTEQLLF